jgi:D-alanyl-D-alanine carboxypeptidase (penicillin-binding protein 5/6)
MISAAAALFAVLLAVPASAQMATSAEHAILMDGATGQVLWAKDAYTPVPPASMSKLMTLELLFQRLADGRLHLDDRFPVSQRAWSERSGSECFVAIGDKMRIEDLIRCIIIVSGNDSCITLAEGIGGTVEGFVDMMNARAKELGLKGSHFVNPDGLPDPPGQVMSVFDLATLARHLVLAYPQYYHYFSERDFVWSGIHQPNRNSVLDKFPGADGLKTGHIDASGYGVVVSALRGGRRLILVLNGLRYPDLAHDAPPRQDWFGNLRRGEEAARLLQLAYREFRQYRLYKAGDVIDQAEVFGGAEDKVPLTVVNEVAPTMQVDSRKGLKVVLHYDGPIKAPIAKGQQIGTLNISAPGYPGMTVPVVAAEPVSGAGFFGRIGMGLEALLSRKGS